MTRHEWQRATDELFKAVDLVDSQEDLNELFENIAEYAIKKCNEFRIRLESGLSVTFYNDIGKIVLRNELTGDLAALNANERGFKNGKRSRRN